jgi:ABC-2 type transport system permease protein
VSTVRLLFIGGAMSYRALFNWTTPSMFIGTLLVGPTMQLLFFVYLGRSLGVADDTFYIAGNAVLACSIAGIYGGTMSIANERLYGTLSNLLLSPRGRAAVFLGRGLPYVANGLLVSLFVLGASAALLGWRLPVATLPALATVLLVAAASCTAFGLVLGALGLRLRDMWLLANSSEAALLLFTGANVPPEQLPQWMRTLAEVLPLTHAIEAVRELTAGADFAAVTPTVGLEVLVGCCYAGLAVILMAVFESKGRHRAALDTL